MICYLRPLDYILQPDEGWYWLRNNGPRDTWDRWFGKRDECIDYIDGYCVGYYEIWSRWDEWWLPKWWKVRYLFADSLSEPRG